jgi:serine protease inhibitor
VKIPENANRFGFRLLSQLIESEPQKRNFVVSPLSIQLALGMTYAGANGATAIAIAITLGWDGFSREHLLEVESGLQSSLRNPGKDVVLRIANAIWVDDVQLQPKFCQDLKEAFDSEVFSRSFQNAEIVQDINSWVSTQTSGKISALVARPPSPPLLLVDAGYFKAPWRSAFEARATGKQAFYLDDNTPVEVPMMHKTSFFPYLKSGLFEAVRLPYAGDRFSLVLLLPATGSDAKGLLQRLGQQSWSELQRGFQATECNLTAPRFKIDYDTALEKSLQQLGMEEAFDSRVADFRRMLTGTTPLYIRSVVHKTFLRVDEAGSEAAAATAISMGSSARLNRAVVNLTFDRPFVLAIVDENTQAILFLGLLGDPEHAR